MKTRALSKTRNAARPLARRALGLIGALAACCVLSSPTIAHADPPKADAPKPARSARPKAPRKPVTPPKVDSDAAPAGAAPETDALGTVDGPRAESKEAATEAKEPNARREGASPEGGARVFRFGELEIEGRLKSPQLVYFLRRVRAEFAAADLGHRTFLPELSQTRKEPSF